jgi:hypothetical protein
MTWVDCCCRCCCTCRPWWPAAVRGSCKQHPIHTHSRLNPADKPTASHPRTMATQLRNSSQHQAYVCLQLQRPCEQLPLPWWLRVCSARLLLLLVPGWLLAWQAGGLITYRRLIRGSSSGAPPSEPKWRRTSSRTAWGRAGVERGARVAPHGMSVLAVSVPRSAQDCCAAVWHTADALFTSGSSNSQVCASPTDSTHLVEGLAVC